MAKLAVPLFLIFSLFTLSQARIPRTVSPSDHDVEAVNLQIQDLTDLTDLRPIRLGVRHDPTRFRCGGFRHSHLLHRLGSDRRQFRSYGNDAIFSGPGGHVQGGDGEKERVYVDGFRHRHHLHHHHHGFRSYGDDGIFSGPGFHGDAGHVEGGNVARNLTVRTGVEEDGWMSKVRKFVDAAFGF